MKGWEVLAKAGKTLLGMVVVIVLLCAITLVTFWWIYKFTKNKIVHHLCRKEELQLLHTLGELRKDIRFLELINGDGSTPIWRGKCIDSMEIEICARKKEKELASLCREKGIAQWKINAFIS